MNYPVWDLQTAGGGLLIALIAVFHVYIAHFAVGGGLLLVLTEIKARRLQSDTLLVYTRRHAGFFMVTTLVGGGVSGVGIWFTIALLNPGATSLLIHTFVFGWAAEWVCFAGEIVALLVYVYGFDRLNARDHLRVGWLYFIFAWFSLFWVNGIIDFMLTPGRWVETGSFWDGFFNPTMLPALGFRTALSLVLAGSFGLWTAVRLKELSENERRVLIHYHVRWLLGPMALGALCGLWYWQALPEDVQALAAGHSPELGAYLRVLWLSSLLMMAGAILLLMKLNPFGRRILTVWLLGVGLLQIGGFEFLREGARRPFAVYKEMYANGITVADREKIDQDGFLESARWCAQKQVTRENASIAGRELFRMQCSACHSVGGVMKNIIPLTRKYTLFGMDAQLNGQGKLLDYMPPFMGTVAERRALAGFIVGELNNNALTDQPAVSITPALVTPIPFDEKQDDYLLMAWSSLGMFDVSDCDEQWSLAPPGASVSAQLIKRGETPELITDHVTLRYIVEAAYASPASKVAFWRYAEKFLGRPVSENTGTDGTPLQGLLKQDQTETTFVTNELPLVPYPQTGGFNPYPLVTIEARDNKSQRVLARTKVTVPVSTELGCRNCHGGSWRVDNKAGISSTTAEDVLTVHDRINKTRLKKNADQGSPVRCQACHADVLRHDSGQPGRLPLSTAIHGFHALYLTGRGDQACHACHPSDPQGATRMLRGIHNEIDLSCTNCHGSLEIHAAGLLKMAAEKGNPRGQKLLSRVQGKATAAGEAVAARQAWYGQPDCLHCHVDFQPPDTDQTTARQRTRDRSALYRMRSDDTGIMCAACHGAPHALFPARNPYGEQRDVLVPRQYQGSPYPLGSNRNCNVCHTIDMEEEIHHPNMSTMFRNTIN